MSPETWGPVFLAVVAFCSIACLGIAVRVRRSIALMEEGSQTQEILGYELVSLFRRLEEDRRALAIRLRFSRWAAFLIAPAAAAGLAAALGSAAAVTAFFLVWLLAGLLDAGLGVSREASPGPTWIFRAWVRLTEAQVRLGLPLQKLRQGEPEADGGMRRILAESQASLMPLGGALGVEERRLLRKLLASTAILVSDIMTKWPKVRRVDEDVSLAELLESFRRSGHSRLPVSRDGRIVGLIHVKDALVADKEVPLSALTRPPYFVRQETVIQVVLDSLRDAREHLAVVVDELGRAVGVVTVEDILEELVGELYDEREAPVKETS